MLKEEQPKGLFQKEGERIMIAFLQTYGFWIVLIALFILMMRMQSGRSGHGTGGCCGMGGMEHGHQDQSAYTSIQVPNRRVAMSSRSSARMPEMSTMIATIITSRTNRVFVTFLLRVLRVATTSL
jgi:hypothetical protein